MGCTRCNHRMNVDGQVRYCKNYVSCKKGCVSKCWLHTSPQKQRCDVDRGSARVVVIMMAHDGVRLPYVWEKWRDALGKRREGIKFLLHVDKHPPPADGVDGLEFTKRYESEMPNIQNLDGARGTFPLVAMTIVMAGEALDRFPNAKHLCFVDGATVPMCEPSKLLALDEGKSYISHSFLCLGEGEDVVELDVFLRNLKEEAQFKIPNRLNWDDEDDHFGYGLLNHHRDMILSREHVRALIDSILRRKPPVVTTPPLTYNLINAALRPFGSLNAMTRQRFVDMLNANPDEYVIGNALAIALGRAEFRRTVVNTHIVAYIKYHVTDEGGKIDRRARTFKAVSKNHKAVRLTLAQVLRHLRNDKGDAVIQNLRPQNLKNVLFFRKVASRINQIEYLNAADLSRQIDLELWPELGVNELANEVQQGDDSYEDSSDGVSVDSSEEGSD